MIWDGHVIHAVGFKSWKLQNTRNARTPRYGPVVLKVCFQGLAYSTIIYMYILYINVTWACVSLRNIYTSEHPQDRVVSLAPLWVVWNSLLLRNGGVFVQCQGEQVLLLRVESPIASGASCHRRVDPCQLACDTGVGVLRGPLGKDSTDPQILWQKWVWHHLSDQFPGGQVCLSWSACDCLAHHCGKPWWWV